MASLGAAQLAGMMFMPYYNEILRIVETNHGLKQTISGILHQLKYAAIALVIGACVLGPFGALIGGIIGSVYGYMTVHSYSSLIRILNSMSEDEKNNLVNEVRNLVGSDTVEALTNFVQSQVNRNALFGLLSSFVTGSRNSASMGQQKMHTS